jgi:hypothetical protein
VYIDLQDFVSDILISVKRILQVPWAFPALFTTPAHVLTTSV